MAAVHEARQEDPRTDASSRRRRSLRRRRPVPASAEPLADTPIRRWAVWALLGDIESAVVAGIIARIGRFGFDDAVLANDLVRVPYAVLAFGLAALWPIATALSGAYGYRVALFGVEELRRLLRAAVGLLAFVGVAHFMFQLELARGFVGIFIPLVVVLSALWRMLLRVRISRGNRRGLDRHRAVVVGPTEEIERVLLALETMPGSPIDLVAFAADDLGPADHTPTLLDGVHRLPDRGAIATLAADGVPFDLVLRAGRPAADEMWGLARTAHEHRAALAMAPDRNDHSNVAWSYLPLGSTPLLLVETPAMHPGHRVAKEVFDRVTATALTVVLAPVLAAIALTILVRDGRPIFFRQERVGRDGTTFRCWKFRTMVPDAEARLKDLEDRNVAGGPLFKVPDDPRVTKTGRFLRAHSLDELPQLCNVLAGDMSLVGPRPPLAVEVATYDERAARRLLVKPGMTGLWQVQGRSDLPWDEGVYLDLLYVDHWSPLLDLVIMARTLRTIIRPAGAY